MREGTDINSKKTITCDVCPRACKLDVGQVGVCKARANIDGEGVSLNYGKCTGLALDPVEKKPLAMWQSGKSILSVGSFGCNLKCPFCQNWEIACAGDGDLFVREVTPQDLVNAALKARPYGNVGLAFTYNEPLIGWEFVRDTARLAKEHGLLNVAVTNGMVSQRVLHEVLPYLDAVNIDLKGFTPEFYGLCLTGKEPGTAGFRLGQKAFDTVRNTIEQTVAAPHCHVEVTTLVVPGSDFDYLEKAACWLAGLDRNIPYHVTQYHPAHLWNTVRPLPNREVRAVANTARKYLNNVFTGNM